MINDSIVICILEWQSTPFNKFDLIFQLNLCFNVMSHQKLYFVQMNYRQSGNIRLWHNSNFYISNVLCQNKMNKFYPNKTTRSGCQRRKLEWNSRDIAASTINPNSLLRMEKLSIKISPHQAQYLDKKHLSFRKSIS